MKAKPKIKYKPVVCGIIAEQFVHYRLQLTSKGKITKVKQKYYDLIEVFGTLHQYNDRKIEVKACQLFTYKPKYNRTYNNTFKISKLNHNKLLKQDGVYVFVYMFKSKILFAITYDARKLDKIPKQYYKVNKKNNNKYFNLKNTCFVDKNVEVI